LEKSGADNAVIQKKIATELKENGAQNLIQLIPWQEYIIGNAAVWSKSASKK